MIQHMREDEVRDELAKIAAARKEVEEQLSVHDQRSGSPHRHSLKRRLRELEGRQRDLKAQLHRICAKNTAPGSVNTRVEHVPAKDLPDEGYFARLMMQRAVVAAFKAAYKAEGDYLGEMIEEAQRRDLINPDGTPKLPGQMPFGVVPTLEEVGRPLGYVSGFHTSPGPHFPHHDTRRIYAGMPAWSQHDRRPPGYESKPKDKERNEQ